MAEAGPVHYLEWLIELGKRKGFLTYDEVNDLLPPDEVSPGDIEGLLAMLEEAGIEVVESADEKSRRKRDSASRLTHFDEQGRARMVDVSDKAGTLREAVAEGTIFMKPETFSLIMQKQVKKGDVLEVARIAGIMAAKRTSELIPMCHPLNVTAVEIGYVSRPESHSILIEGRARVVGKTGVEMEALTAVAVAALTIYDMCKAVDRAMTISEIRLKEKRGGKSGAFRREGS
jgi:cyclic pyranopterin phosphate synthase